MKNLIPVRSPYLLLGFFLTLSLSAMASNAQNSQDSRFWITAEAGGVWQSINEVQIPKEGGTRFSLTELGDGGVFGGRVYLGYRLQGPHELRALYAPLTLNLKGQFDRDISFQDQTFLADTPLEAKYKFNSYRLTYRYTFLSSSKWILKGGFTGKIRDAEIRLTQNSQSAGRNNIGFVPLLHFMATHSFNSNWKFIIDLDALAAPQGRAEDLALLLAYHGLGPFSVYAGYRTIEGGSEGGGGVYNFAWLHFGVLGFEWNL